MSCPQGSPLGSEAFPSGASQALIPDPCPNPPGMPGSPTLTSLSISLALSPCAEPAEPAVGPWFLTRLWAALGHPALKPRSPSLPRRLVPWRPVHAASIAGPSGTLLPSCLCILPGPPAPVSPRASSLKKDLYAVSLELPETPAPGQNRAPCSSQLAIFLPATQAERVPFPLPHTVWRSLGRIWLQKGRRGPLQLGTGRQLTGPPDRAGSQAQSRSKTGHRRADALLAQGGHRRFPKQTLVLRDMNRAMGVGNHRRKQSFH